MKNYRMTAIILALIMMLSLAACGSAQASAQGQETACHHRIVTSRLSFREAPFMKDRRF